MKSEKDDDYECESGDQDELGGWRVRRVRMTRERERGGGRGRRQGVRRVMMMSKNGDEDELGG